MKIKTFVCLHFSSYYINIIEKVENSKYQIFCIFLVSFRSATADRFVGLRFSIMEFCITYTT